MGKKRKSVFNNFNSYNGINRLTNIENLTNTYENEFAEELFNQRYNWTSEKEKYNNYDKDKNDLENPS